MRNKLASVDFSPVQCPPSVYNMMGEDDSMSGLVLQAMLCPNFSHTQVRCVCQAVCTHVHHCTVHTGQVSMIWSQAGSSETHNIYPVQIQLRCASM